MWPSNKRADLSELRSLIMDINVHRIAIDVSLLMAEISHNAKMHPTSGLNGTLRK